MKASSNDVVALASTELTTPAKITPKPTTAIATAPSQAERDTRVPANTKTAPTSTRAMWACRRSRIGPLKSTNKSIANEPNAANVAKVGSPITLSPKANMAGMMIAVRAARRNAAYPGSCRPNHPRALDQLLMTLRRPGR